MIAHALTASILWPLLASVLLTAIPWKSENWIAGIATTATFLSSLCAVTAIALWLRHGLEPLKTQEYAIFEIGAYRFQVGLWLDSTAAAFLFLIGFTAAMVIRFSRIYMHREPGYRRFFAVILMFQGAMALLTLASNLDLLFCGWEMVGLASFLLIAFYYKRWVTVRNALKTFSIYRIADVGLFLAALLEHTSARTETGLLLVLAAAGKSAQFPFSFWVVRAMEGPTPSSALFYGALSVNVGAFLLLRTYSIWGGSLAVHVIIGAVGLTSVLLCSLFSRVQHTIKAQIGYASTAQVGLIFFEISLGWTHLALFHLLSNALFRCYQLLVSPSAVAYLLRQQSSSGATLSEERSIFQNRITSKLRSTLYVFAISEGFLERSLRNFVWAPFRKLGSQLWIGWTAVLIFLLLFGSQYAAMGLAFCFSILAIALLPSKERAVLAVSTSALCAAVALVGHDAAIPNTANFGYIIFLIVFCGLSLWAATGEIKNRTKAVLTLIGVLGISGFPLLPTFFGEDILLHQAFVVKTGLPFALSALFALNGYIAMRLFASAILTEP